MKPQGSAVFAAVWAAFVFGALLLAQNPASQAPTFRGKVEIVQLDVSVLDKHRQPVRGLTEKDFTILEDGKPQPIVSFSAFDMDTEAPPTVGWMRDVPPDVATNESKESRLVVLVMDDALIPQDPWMMQASKKIAASIIDKLDPNDLTAVVFTGDNRKTQDFTNEKSKLRAAVDGFSPGLASYRFGMDTPGIDVDYHFYLSSVRTLTEVSDYLIRAPGRRKVLFWVSPGVPMDIEGWLWDAQPRQSAIPTQHLAALPYIELKDRTSEMFRRAQRANVAVYPIDPSGLGGLAPYLAGTAKLFGSSLHGKVNSFQDFLAATAANTGGRTVMNINEFEPGIQEVFDENKSYYFLAFEPLKSEADGKLRRLDVKVNRPDVEVRARSGYYAPEPEKASKNKPSMSPENSELAKAIGGVLPDSRLPMRVVAAPLVVPGQRLSTVTVVLGIRQPVPTAAAKERVTETTELQISAFTPEGDPKGTQRHTARVVLRAGADGEAAYEVLGRIDLPTGRYRLRLAATNAASGKTGSVFADVVVPDYANAPFSASPMVLSASPGRVSAPKDLLTAVLPIVPTAEREFARTDRLTALLRLYQSGQKPIGQVTVTMTLRGAGGQTNTSAPQQIGVDQFALVNKLPSPGTMIPGQSTPSTDSFTNTALRASDVRFQVPLNTLAPGEHLLSIDATLGATTIRRDVRFSVK